MDTYIFATKINHTEAEGIINTKTQMVLCLCNEENSKTILKALNFSANLPTVIEIQNHAFEWRKRACYLGNYGLEKQDGMIAGGEWVLNEIRRRLNT